MAVAETRLREFVTGWPYTKVLNVHSLNHLAACVREHGPLQTFWANPFEGAHFFLKNQGHARRLPEKQLCLSANIASCIPYVQEELKKQNLSEKDEEVRSYLELLSENYLYL